MRVYFVFLHPEVSTVDVLSPFTIDPATSVPIEPIRARILGMTYPEQAAIPWEWIAPVL
jgi:hypothetical protein